MCPASPAPHHVCEIYPCRYKYLSVYSFTSMHIPLDERTPCPSNLGEHLSSLQVLVTMNVLLWTFLNTSSVHTSAKCLLRRDRWSAGYMHTMHVCRSHQPPKVAGPIHLPHWESQKAPAAPSPCHTWQSAVASHGGGTSHFPIKNYVEHLFKSLWYFNSVYFHPSKTLSILHNLSIVIFVVVAFLTTWDNFSPP